MACNAHSFRYLRRAFVLGPGVEIKYTLGALPANSSNIIPPVMTKATGLISSKYKPSVAGHIERWCIYHVLLGLTKLSIGKASHGNIALRRKRVGLVFADNAKKRFTIALRMH